MIEDDDEEDSDDDQVTIVNMDIFVKGRRGQKDKFYKGDKNRHKAR